MARYKWDSAYEWLEEKSQDWDATRLRTELLDLARQTDGDTIQDSFQSEMDSDGYFRDLDVCRSLTRAACVALLEGISIECRDDESLADLRGAVEANLEDGELSYEAVEGS